MRSANADSAEHICQVVGHFEPHPDWTSNLGSDKIKVSKRIVQHHNRCGPVVQKPYIVYRTEKIEVGVFLESVLVELVQYYKNAKKQHPNLENHGTYSNSRNVYNTGGGLVTDCPATSESLAAPKQGQLKDSLDDLGIDQQGDRFPLLLSSIARRRRRDVMRS